MVNADITNSSQARKLKLDYLVCLIVINATLEKNNKSACSLFFE